MAAAAAAAAAAAVEELSEQEREEVGRADSLSLEDFAHRDATLTLADVQAVSLLLGRVPHNIVRVAARDAAGRPTVVMGYPLQQKNVMVKAKRKGAGKRRRQADSDAPSPAAAAAAAAAVTTSDARTAGHEENGEKEENEEEEDGADDGRGGASEGDDGGVSIRPAETDRRGRKRHIATERVLIPFPTLYWLCGKEEVASVGVLEEQGHIGLLKQRLEESPEDVKSRMRAAHEAYANARWALLLEEHRGMVEERGWNGLRTGGVAGLSDYLSVKCLHGHYAHYLAAREDGNVIGEWVQELIDSPT